MTETITLRISNGHQIWIRKGLPMEKKTIRDPVLFDFPSNGYKYLGIYTKKIPNKTIKEDKTKWKKKNKQA